MGRLQLPFVPYWTTGSLLCKEIDECAELQQGCLLLTLPVLEGQILSIGFQSNS